MKGFDLYQVGTNLYRINSFDNVRLYFRNSKTWRACYASAEDVREHGKLIAKNVVFK